MAWPFSSAPAPSFDTGIVTLNATPAVNVPNLSGATVAYLMGAWFANNNATLVTITVTDNAGAIVIPTTDIAGKGVLPFTFAFMPVAGLKWYASTATGVTGKIWGYQ